MPFTLSENEKFGVVAVHNLYTDLKDDQTQLSEATWVLRKVPFEIEKIWQKWLRIVGIIGTSEVMAGSMARNRHSVGNEFQAKVRPQISFGNKSSLRPFITNRLTNPVECDLAIGSKQSELMCCSDAGNDAVGWVTMKCSRQLMFGRGD